MNYLYAQNITADTLDQNYLVALHAVGHDMIADEPLEVGGGNMAPNPTGYLLVALGACTSITLQMYAQHKKWPLTKIHVELNLKKTKAAGADNDTILRWIRLDGELDDAQKERLIEIANNCPMHRVLRNSFTIETNLLPI